MSSNGFLQEIELLSLPRCLSMCSDSRLRRFRLTVNAAGEWYLHDGADSLPVLLLPHRSYWTTRFAGISLQQLDCKPIVLWFKATEQPLGSWRRARVRIIHPL